jgi:mannose-6-phosphate isomerase-like protein (cupin superfamily)
MPNTSTGAREPQPQYVLVDDVAYGLAAGCVKTFSKHLLSTERLEIKQTSIRGPGAAEDYGISGATRAAYVLAGTAKLKHAQAPGTETEIRKGHLLVIPAGATWGQQLSLLSDELVLLEVTETAGGVETARVSAAAHVRAVDPTEVKAYEPAGHAKTRNRCLFVDRHMEIIEGLIERGGGAERHSHRDNEQLLYVLGGAGAPLLIYYPQGAPHGTGGGVPEPLQLLVIYSPPLGEAQNALA